MFLHSIFLVDANGNDSRGECIIIIITITTTTIIVVIVILLIITIRREFRLIKNFYLNFQDHKSSYCKRDFNKRYLETN